MSDVAYNAAGSFPSIFAFVHCGGDRHVEDLDVPWLVASLFENLGRRLNQSAALAAARA